jgi:hypothetical protein
MDINFSGRKFIRFMYCFVLFTVIQFINSDWSSVSVNTLGIKMAYAFLTTVIFLLLSMLINKWTRKHERT